MAIVRGFEVISDIFEIRTFCAFVLSFSSREVS
jgi:hypothetical protein